MSYEYGIHWFRRDLRVTGNPALYKNWKENKGRVVGLFCFDRKFLARPDFSVNRFQFFIRTLEDLKLQLQDGGSDLCVLDVGPEEAFPNLFDSLSSLPTLFTWNRDYEPFAIDRDLKVAKLLQQRNIRHHTERDHVLIEPNEIRKTDGSHQAYQIFTPFSRKWLESFQSEEVKTRVSFSKKTISEFQLNWRQLLKNKYPKNDILQEYEIKNGKKITVPIPKAGKEAVDKCVRDFGKRLGNYGKDRDYPALYCTSHFSIFLKNGSLTLARIICDLELEAYAKNEKNDKAKFLSELIWREFYYYILVKFPHVEKRNFQSRYDRLKWTNNEDWFEAWKTGRTGFPIVDAGMRQLITTGWMHNRVRMIVASFLTKDLHIDWKWGERYFMEQLLDGDLAPNNGGWQWAASTGCDPQPYFRIFNPYLQSEKFDPKGEYIRRFVPELSHLSEDNIHQPPASLRGEYPAPIVDHKIQKEKTLAAFKKLK